MNSKAKLGLIAETTAKKPPGFCERVSELKKNSWPTTPKRGVEKGKKSSCQTVRNWVTISLAGFVSVATEAINGLAGL